MILKLKIPNKIYICFFIVNIFVLLSTISFGQQKKFQGELEIGNQKVKYEINFSIDLKNNIVGTSITDKGGKDENQSRIKGKFFPEKNKIEFEETTVLRNKTKGNTFCMIHATVFVKPNNYRDVLRGDFIGYLKDKNEKCGDGKIYLLSESGQHIIEEKKEIEKIQLPISVTKIDTLNSNSNEENKKILNWKNNKIELEIWDDKSIDGDEVSVFVNEKEVLKNYVTAKEKKQLSFSFPEKAKKCVVKIVSISEGKTPPNTSRCTLKDGNESYDFLAHIKNKQEIIFELRK